MRNTTALCIICIVSSIIMAYAGERAGIVEFEIKNDIDLENANTIIPEMLTSYLKQINIYTLYERILLKKILEEQELQMSDLIDERTAVRIGELFGLEIIIFGSAAKIGKKILINGRSVRVQTGEIIASGSVKFPIEEIDQYLEKLSYILSGYNEYQYRFIKYEQRILKSNFGFKLGSGYSYNDSSDSAKEWSPLNLEIYYKSRYIDLAIFGTMPLNKVTLIGGLVNYNPLLQLGVGIAYLYSFDDLLVAHLDKVDVEYYSGQINSLLLGLNYRPLENIRLGVYAGYELFGDFSYQDKSNKYYEYEVYTKFEFPPSSWIVFIEYDFTEDVSVKLQWLQNGAWGEATEYPVDFDEWNMTNYLGTQSLSISFGYNFSI